MVLSLQCKMGNGMRPHVDASWTVSTPQCICDSGQPGLVLTYRRNAMKRLLANSPRLSRRNFLAAAGGLGVAGLLGTFSRPARAGGLIELPFANGRRELASDFPQKGAMILPRTRPPLLETPFEVFDQSVFTPNDRFYVRWHLANIPTAIDPADVRLQVRGHVR